MRKKEVTLKPRRDHLLDKVKGLFADKKKRYLFMVLFILPFVILIGIFSAITIKEAKNIINLVSGAIEVKDENKIESMNYILRDNATDYQKELFAELKNAIEVDAASDDIIAGLVCKNYVADYYTWTNKQGQYDVGGMHYIYDGEFEDGDHFKENVFLKARNGFYKYVNTYINQYGAENLLEVDNITITNCVKRNDVIINEHVANKQDENGEWYDYREDHTFDAYDVTCTWTYKQNGVFDTSKYCTKSNFIVIKNNKFVIIAADENNIMIDKSNETIELEEEIIEEDNESIE